MLKKIIQANFCRKVLDKDIISVIRLKVDKKEDSNSVNEEELMQYYGFTGNFGKFQLKTKLFSTTLLHSLAYNSLH